VLGRQREDHDLLYPALRPTDREAITGSDRAMWLRPLFIHIHLTASTGALGLRSGLEEAGDIEPHVEPDRAWGDGVDRGHWLRSIAVSRSR
jgi:hypothetical protein